MSTNQPSFRLWPRLDAYLVCSSKGASRTPFSDNAIYHRQPHSSLDLHTSLYLANSIRKASLLQPRMHNVGFTPRPRLRGRPSFYDLIKSTAATVPQGATATDSLPVVRTSLPKELHHFVASSVPLPTSPTQPHHSLLKSTNLISEAPYSIEHTEPFHIEATMASVSVAPKSCSQ